MLAPVSHSRSDRCTHVIVVLNLPVPDDRRVWEQARALVEDGCRVEILCPAMRGHRPGRKNVDGITVTYMRTFEGASTPGLVIEGVWNTLLCLLRLPGLIRRGVDSLQVCNPPDSLFPVLFGARLSGIRTVYDQHDVVPAMAAERGNLRFARGVFELFERLTVRSADVVLTSSATQQRRLEERFGVRPVLVRSATVLDSAGTAPLDTEDRGECHLGYLGVIGAQEGIEDLLEAVAMARESCALSVTIAGDGPFLDAARSEARRLGIDGVVTFAGWLQGAELETFLRSIDAMIVTDPESEYNHYCAMNKVLEAMARGMPVLMRPLAENTELTGHHRWIAEDWSTRSLADVLVDFATCDPHARARVGRTMQDRYAETADWSVGRRTYVNAVRPLVQR